ncbi:TetR/AcrR family transcriptional regulator [Nonomuraea fuscirosea]|uniref:TetR/AcrR family transcriptional regulator n=1 Tax=Nonomuraea fuscirosea TaxID=1291556 RepID=UPI003437015D
MSRAIAAVQTPGRRRRSEGKKAAILDAAEALFIAEGYERASVDTIAARAQVSKRTVYDHFGDKATIFLKALERVNDALTDAVQAAIEEELTPGRDLREALTAFGRRVVTQTVPSSDYVTFRRLTSQHWAVPRLAEAVRDRPERMLEERFAALAAGGELTAADPRLAARHFTALTIGLALETLEAGGDVSEPEIVTVIADGVDAFLRAYRSGPA